MLGFDILDARDNRWQTGHGLVGGNPLDIFESASDPPDSHGITEDSCDDKATGKQSGWYTLKQVGQDTT